MNNKMNNKTGGSLASNRVHSLLKGDCKKGGKRTKSRKSRKSRGKKTVVKRKSKTGKRSRSKSVKKKRTKRSKTGGGDGEKLQTISTRLVPLDAISANIYELKITLNEIHTYLKSKP